ncbi:hypothetical protein CMO96_01030 [Candidatus Woesebacteria bacterium]|nr:hypothetical protein [Candidatus Woesebacteria bacterium]|tara:strand:+ start:22 stop:240 length:219 start_codon:yes stop_codon:yes gene_type:complete
MGKGVETDPYAAARRFERMFPGIRHGCLDHEPRPHASVVQPDQEGELIWSIVYNPKQKTVRIVWPEDKEEAR